MRACGSSRTLQLGFRLALDEGLGALARTRVHKTGARYFYLCATAKNRRVEIKILQNKGIAMKGT